MFVSCNDMHYIMVFEEVIAYVNELLVFSWETVIVGVFVLYGRVAFSQYAPSESSFE